MERLQFVDATLHQVPGDVFDNSCYAIDLGICSSFAKRGLPGENLHRQCRGLNVSTEDKPVFIWRGSAN